MKKIIILFISCLFVYSCSYKKVNNSQNQKFYIKNINIDGNKKIGYYLKNEIALMSSVKGTTKINVNLDVEKEKKVRIKNIKGKNTKYTVLLKVKVLTTNLNTKKQITRFYERSETYDAANNHSETINNENSSVKNLAGRISEDIINDLSLSLKN